LERLWDELARPDRSTEGSTAFHLLVGAPREAVPFLTERLRQVTPVDPQHVARLVDDLGSDSFETRQKATEELRSFGRVAEIALTKTLAAKPSLEVQRRLEDLLKVAYRLPPTEQRAAGALTVLEHLGTAEAHQAIEELARGTPDAWLTEEAKVALRRLEMREAPKGPAD
jgi:hypothetical protein